MVTFANWGLGHSRTGKKKGGICHLESERQLLHARMAPGRLQERNTSM